MVRIESLIAHVTVTDETDYAASFVVIESKLMDDKPIHAPLIIDVAGTELNAGDRRRLADPLVGGVIHFARNWQDRAQLTALNAEIKAVRRSDTDLRRP